MKQLFLSFTFCLFFASCMENPSYISGKSKMYGTNDGTSSSIEINYFKDDRTNLCFAERGRVDSYTMTCVPCDSVKQFIK